MKTKHRIEGGLPRIIGNSCVLASLLLASVSAEAVRFRLPLSSDTAVHYYYDHNTSSGVTAWNCSGNSYDGHQGNDYSGGPRGRAIFAAASGTLNYKIDGFGDGYKGSPDGGGAGNHVRIDHGGGIITWYMHMTVGSVTGKGVGSAMACSEQIGGVGTSGSSTGLHLHFDLRINGARRDPHIGSCGGSDYWVNQNGGSPTTTCEGASAVSRWYFDTGTDGWLPVNGTTGLGWSASGWPGIIYADQNANDAYWHSPGTSFAAAAEYSINVDVYPQSGTTANHDMAIFWKTAQDNTWTAGKSTPVVGYALQNGWARINLDVGAWSGTINQLRLDFDQANSGTRWIVNHVFTQKTPKYWFGSSASGWASGNGLSGVVWTASGWPGIIYADQTGNDGYFMGPGGQDYLGGINDVLRVRVYPQGGATANHDLKLYWTTESSGISEANSTPTIIYVAKDTWADLTIPVGHKPEWSGHFIQQLRLDVDGVNQGNRWIIDYVAVSHLTSKATIAVPGINQQPQSQTVNAGSPASFSVFAIGIAPFTYQWKKNGADISGATGSSYAIASAQGGDAATYTVVVSNGGGSVTSAGAVLTVNGVSNVAPVLAAIGNKTVNENSALQFTAAATDANAGQILT